VPRFGNGAVKRANITDPIRAALTKGDDMVCGLRIAQSLSPSAHRGFNLGCCTASCRDDFDAKVRSGSRKQTCNSLVVGIVWIH
jgi:hypothetical protein